MKNTKITKGKVVTLIVAATLTLSLGTASTFAAAGLVLITDMDGNPIPSTITDSEIPPPDPSGMIIDMDSVNLNHWREFTPEEYAAYKRGEINLGDGVQRRGRTEADGTERIYELIARLTTSTILVNGKNVPFDAYTIMDNNFFKLRDLAYVLSGTEKQFEVNWNAENSAISLTSGKPYTPIGGELASGGSENRTPLISGATIYIDGKEVRLFPYNIGGNNYFRLRDIGKALNFDIAWDGVANTIKIDTGASYSPE